MGGGATAMGINLPTTEKACYRKDGRDLIKQWLLDNPGSKVVRNVDELLSVDLDDTTKLMGIFAADHFPYTAVKTDDIPTLANMTVQAIKLLQKNQNGFVLMVIIIF